jgi:hypothetical protein
MLTTRPPNNETAISKDVMAWSLTGNYQHTEEIYCPHNAPVFYPEGGDSKYIENAGNHLSHYSHV